jgi:hypothetical protein
MDCTPNSLKKDVIYMSLPVLAILSDKGVDVVGVNFGLAAAGDQVDRAAALLDAQVD